MSIELDRSAFTGRRLLVAVSGGADSMCLLHLLHSAGEDLTAAHFEHGIRGEESLRDARFVEDYCRGRGIPFLLGHGDVPGHAAAARRGIEESARELRYAFLEQSADACGAELILTAHNADDNAETLLLHLARGSGTAGLRGIPRRRGRILRPLLDVTRAEIEAYLCAHAVPFVHDSTNGSDDYTRNLIRSRVMPALREINPRFAAAAGRCARLAGQDEDFLAACAADFLRRQSPEEGIAAAALDALHPAVAARVLRLLIPGLSMEQLEAVLDFARGRGSGRAVFGGQALRRERGLLCFGGAEVTPLPARRLVPGETLFLPEAGLSLRAERGVYRGEVHDLFTTSFLKYEIIGPGLFCTGRLPGDRIRPLGRGCGKTLKALFAEAGLGPRERACRPVLRDENGPLLVFGLAMDERAAPQPGDSVLKITFSGPDA